MSPWRAVVLLLVAIFFASPAHAQSADRPASPGVERGYLIGSAGLALNAPRSPAFAFEIAENMGPIAQAYLNFAYFDDLMDDGVRARVVALGDDLSAATATSWAFSGRDRGRAFSGGARVQMPTRTAVRPFVGAGIGALNVKRIITDRFRGDLTREVLSQFTFGDALVDPTQASTTRPMGEVVAGVGAAIGHLHVEGTYRYRRAFHTGETLDVSQAGIAAGVSF